VIVVSLTKARRGFGLFFRVFAALVLAGVVLPRAMDVITRSLVPAALTRNSGWTFLLEKILQVARLVR